jgi:hypothetical protein
LPPNAQTPPINRANLSNNRDAKGALGKLASFTPPVPSDTGHASAQRPAE